MHVDWALRVDALTAVMLVVVTTRLGARPPLLLGLYGGGRQPAALLRLSVSLFTFAMLMLVTADNLVQMFFGWEGVGLASYLLIGFWYHKPSANAAAIKAFIVNRIGDFGFSLGIFGTFLVFGTVSIPAILAAAPHMAGSTIGFLGQRVDTMTLLCILLFIGACGKSAQLGLHTWLPDAMEGPTPVSALIHAATMVTAGVFMVCRLSPMFQTSATATAVVTVVGAADRDLRGHGRHGPERHQAGDRLFDLLATGLHVLRRRRRRLWRGDVPPLHPRLLQGPALPRRGQRDPRHAPRAGHAFLRRAAEADPLHLLGDAGRHARDHRRRHHPDFGLPSIGFAGFFSKDAIIESAYASSSAYGGFAWFIGVFAALLTSFYSWRLIFLTFYGKPRWAASEHIQHALHGAHGTTIRTPRMPATTPMSMMRARRRFRQAPAGYHPHESPWTMLVPLALLSLGAIAAGMVFHAPFIDPEAGERFWAGSVAFDAQLMHEMHLIPLWVKLSASAAMLIGFAIAFYAYVANTAFPAAFVDQFGVLYRFLLNKWYFDELYDVDLRAPLALARPIALEKGR